MVAKSLQSFQVTKIKYISVCFFFPKNIKKNNGVQNQSKVKNNLTKIEAGIVRKGYIISFFATRSCLQERALLIGQDFECDQPSSHHLSDLFTSNPRLEPTTLCK